VEEPRPGTERTRAFWQRFLVVAGEAPHLLAGINTMTAPHGRVMLPNGDFVTARESDALAQKLSDSFPDLAVEIDDVFYPDDRVVVQLRMVGSTPAGSPFMPAGQPYTANGCAIVRPNADLLIEEAISITNPGFPFSFPPSGIKLTPPPPDGATELEARALFASWVRHAEAGEDFVSSVLRTLAPDGVVHIGNGDTGNGKTLASLFERVMVGLPDLTMVIDDVIYCDARVIVRFTMSGTHTGPLGMYPATGRVLPSVGVLIARPNANSQAAELWVYLAPAYSVLMPPKG